MALPVSRNRTYSVGSPVVAADMNDLQDQVIGAYAGKRGNRRVIVPAIAGMGTTGITITNGGCFMADPAGVLQVPLPVEYGALVTRMEVRVDPAASGTMSALFLKRTAAGVLTQLGSTQVSSGAAAQTLAVTTSELVNVDSMFYAEVIVSNSSSHLVLFAAIETLVP